MYADENILYINEGSGDVVFNCNEMDILNIDLSDIGLDYNFDEDHPDATILIRLFTWHIEFGKGRELKKAFIEESMPLAWHLDRWWDWRMPEDEKKKKTSKFYSRATKVRVGNI